MTLNEPWATRARLRDALAEAAASYASAEAAASDAPRAEVAPGDQSATGAATEDDRHAARLHTVAAERDQYLDHLQRLKAEFENYRKRVQRDNEALVLRAGEGVIESLLPVVDNMQRALEPAERQEEGQLIKGVELVAGQLRSVLEGHGLDEVPAAPGLPFDPSVHEAVVAQESDEYSEGMISAVLEPGYLLHGRLLRPARVIVAR
jgi:molecular chaperone GrpE